MNKQSLITILLTVLMSMFAAEVSAHDIEVANTDGVTIYYNWINKKTELSVGCRGLTFFSYSNEYSGNVVIPESVEYNGSTYSVTSIGGDAFYGCSGLTSITIPNSVTSIGNNAFSKCSGLTSVTIPNRVISIGGYAFDGCSALTAVTIPNSVTSIGNYAFKDCSGLTSVSCLCSPASAESSIFSGCTNLQEVTFDCEQVTSLFKGIISISKITMTDKVASIGESAFYGCSGLTSVTIPNSVTSIEHKAFYNCSGLPSVTIGNNVTSIGDWAFYGCSGLTFITIPNNVTSIGDDAFYGCSGLTSITIPNSVTSIGWHAFSNCSGLTSVSCLCSPASVGDYIFDGCTNLQEVTFDCKQVTSLFKSRDSITKTTMTDKVTSIGEKAFYCCYNLTSVIIPNSVTSIGNYAFYSCHLSDMYVLATEVPGCSSSSFNREYEITLHVPEGCYDKYAAVEPWKNFKEIKELKSDFIITPYDVNNDGSLDDDDMQNLLDIIMKRIEENDGAEAIYDTNNDGKIDVVDIVQLLGLMNDIKEGRLLDIDEENEGGYVDPTETEQQIGQLEADEDNASEVIYTDEETLNNDALAREVISLYDTDDDSDYYGGDVVKTRVSYDDMAKEAFRSKNGINRFKDEIDIEQYDENIKNWGNTRYAGFKTFYNTREENFVRYLYVVFYYKGGFPNKKTVYLKLGQLNSGKIISSTTILTGQEYAVLRVCIDKYIPGYGCFNVFPLLITEESKARNYRNPIFVKSKQIVAKDWKNKNYGYEFGKINGVSVYCNTSTQGWNIGGKKYQCVELCKRYIKQLNDGLNRKETDIWGHAQNWPYNRKNDDKDPGKYLVFPNDGKERVREGDLIVWHYGDFGHIGVVISVKDDTIRVAHQNGGTGTNAFPIEARMLLKNGIIKDIVPGTNRSPIFNTIERVTHFIRINNPNEHITPYESSMTASTTNEKFSPTQVGKSVTQSFIISNPKGMESLNISSISLSKGDAFSVDLTNGSIAPGDAQVVRIKFTPSSAGEYKDRIIIRSDADDNPTWVIHLTGTGVAD